MAKYVKRLAVNGKAPYLGPFPKMVHCAKVSELTAASRFVDLAKKCRGIEQLPDYPQIERVHCTYDDDLIAILAAMPNLKHVQLRLPKSPDISSLKQLSQIETLVLRCNKNQTSLNFLKGMENLRFLCVSEAMGVDRLTPIGSLINLEELYIDGTISGRNTIASLAPIGRLHALQYLLLLVRVEKTKRNLKSLHKLADLAFLHLSDDYTDADYQDVLKRLPKLDEICFNGGKRVSAES